MQEVWKRIEAWLKTYEPEVLQEIEAGATEEEIQRFEQEIGYQLPADIRESLLMHNGCESFFIDGWELLSIKRILQEQQIQLQVLHGLEEGRGESEEPVWWWYPHWIPFASFGNGDLLCIEVDPTSQRFGQIIEFVHEMESCWIAASYQAMFSAFTNHLEAGEYEMDEGGWLQSQTWSLEGDPFK